MKDLEEVQPIPWGLHHKCHFVSVIVLGVPVLVEMVALDGTKNELPTMLFLPMNIGCHSLILNLQLLIHAFMWHLLLEMGYLLPYSEFPCHSSFVKSNLLCQALDCC